MSTIELTAEQALTELRNNPQNYRTAEQLKALADRVSVYSAGSTTVLYGGNSGFVKADGSLISTNELIETMNRQGLDTRNINKTEVAKFLSDGDYQKAVANAFGTNDIGLQTRGTPANDFLYNASTGEWARASDRFALDTKGDVRILGSFAAQDRTLNLVELGRVMGDADVTKINGIDKAIYQKVYDTALTANGGDVVKAQTALLESVKFSSSELLKDFRISGTSDALRIGTGEFLQGTGVADAKLPADLVAGSERFGNLYATVGDKMTPSEVAEWGRGANQLAVAAEEVSGVRIANAGLKFMTYGGTALAAAVTVDTAYEIKNALDAGDTAKAQALAKDWTASMTGGLAGSVAAGSLATQTLSPLLAAGPAGAAIYLTLVGTSALVGGYWGTEGAKALLDALSFDGKTASSDSATTRLNDTWVATDLGNGSRLLSVSPSDPNTVVVLSSGVYQKLEIPDGKGGFIQVAVGDKSTDVTSWAGVPNQSEQLKRVLTTNTEAGQNVKTYQGTVLATESNLSSQTVNGQTVQVTETVNHLAQGNEVASSKELVISGGARIVNSTTADGHIQEETYATVDGKQELQSSKVLSYSQAERDTAALDVSLAGLELMQALRAGNKVQAAASLIRLANNAEIASNQMPTLGAIGTGFSGAVSIVSALDSWGDASDGERIALTARAVLGANEVAKAFSVDGQTGFLQNSQALGALQGVVALANLDDVLDSGNPFAIASTFMSIANSAALVMQQAAMFGPQVMIAVAIASIVFGSLFGDEPEYPAPPPAGTAEIGHLADGSLGLLIKDSDGHINEERSLTGQVLARSYPQDSYSDESGASYSQERTLYNNQDWGLGAQVLSERITSLIADLQAQAGKDGTHLLLERLPSVSVHGYPSFDGNGVNNFFFALQFNNVVSGAQQMLATAHQDLAAQFKEVAGYAGALVGETEWAQIQAKQAAGDATTRMYATETEGQYVDRQSGAKEGDSLLTQEQAKAQADSNRQSYSLLTLDLEGDGITRRAKAQAGMDLDSIKADTTQGITRLDVDNDGFMELTEWVGSKEAILGIDRNGDGQLSAATELLTGGELSDAAEALGLQRLAFFDANADGKLDKLDAYFNSFKLWLDINGDARTGVGEMYGLTDAGIQSINVNTGAVTFNDGQTLTLQKTQLTADVRGVAVNQSNWLSAA